MRINPAAAVIGMGELGSVFATGLLKLGHPVFPVLRGQAGPDVIRASSAELVVVAVGEDDLDEVLAASPAPGAKLVLIQNELLPPAWERHALGAPNVVVVWFEKKRGKPIHIVLESVISGPQAALLGRCLQAVDVAYREVGPDELLFELVKKNLYILVHNVCGLVENGSVERLWSQHGALAREVASEVLDLQFACAGQSLDRDRLMSELEAAVAADPEHGCAGRTAPARLRRALRQAEAHEVSVPRMTAIAREISHG